MSQYPRGDRGGHPSTQGRNYDIITGRSKANDQEPFLVQQSRAGQQVSTASGSSAHATHQGHGHWEQHAGGASYGHESSSYQGNVDHHAGSSHRHESTRHHSHLDHHTGASHGRYGNDSQIQEQEHLFRNAQASKQMVFEVFGNTIAMLEELEHRELKLQGGRSLGRSDIYLPNQSEYDTATIQRKLETQMLLLQSQLTSCDRQILGEVRDEMKVRTLEWASRRQTKGLQRGVTDKYAGKLFEVLETGKTNHPEEFNMAPTLSEEAMQRAMNAYMQGSQRRSDLDSDFRNNPDKHAMAPRVRAGDGAHFGAERILQERPDMRHALEKYRKEDIK